MNNYGMPPVPPPTPKKKKNTALWIGLGVGILAVLLIVGLIVAAVISIFSSSGDRPYAPDDAYVGVLYVTGTISSAESTGLLYGDGTAYSQSYLLSTIEMLTEDPDNVAILLYVDTPGGEIYATDELYLALEEYKAVTERPIYAYFATTACSGGYYAAMASEYIYANRMTTTGSIGVTYGSHIDLSGFCERLGIKVENITSGANKAMGSYFEPLSDEQREIYTSQLEEYYGYFVDIVAKGRGMTAAEVKPLADGRTYTAKQALAAGLIDGIGSYEEFCAVVTERLGFEADNAPYFFNYYYVAPATDLSALFSALTAEDTPAAELNALLATIKPLRGVLVYYSGQ